MDARSKNLAGVFLTAALAVLVGTTQAAGPKGAGSRAAGGKSGKSYYWYDGVKKRPISTDPELLAEFGQFEKGASPADGGAVAIQTVSPKAEVESVPAKGVRLWKLPPESDGESVAPAASSKEPAGRFSPVFRDGRGGRMRALPGGIVVQLDSKLSDKEAREWARAKGLAVRKKLSLPGNYYVLDTKPGLEALEKANALYESGEVLSASPDWWQEAQAK
ncbi:MAG: hypothetical protein AB1405_08485 [Bdellovibrionota bacterium]